MYMYIYIYIYIHHRSRSTYNVVPISVVDPRFRSLLLKSFQTNLIVCRLVGMLQNSKHFSKMFKCDVSTIMNPDNKCCIL